MQSPGRRARESQVTTRRDEVCRETRGASIARLSLSVPMVRGAPRAMEVPGAAPPSEMGPGLYDLTPTLGKFLDRQMLLPLLDFLGKKKIFAPAELDAANLEVLSATNMVDLAMEVHTKLHGGSPPAAMVARRAEVVASMEALKAEVAPLLAIIDDEAKVAQLKADRAFNQGQLSIHHGITAEHVDALRRYAKFVYDCGDYKRASGLLGTYRTLCTDNEKSFSALWGKLACEILTTNWDAAHDDLAALRDAIDSRASTPPAMQLQQRCWLMHWSLFLL